MVLVFLRAVSLCSQEKQFRNICTCVYIKQVCAHAYPPSCPEMLRNKRGGVNEITTGYECLVNV